MARSREATDRPAASTGSAMIGTIAITDEGWYDFLERRPDLAELNFWTPSARRAFRAPEFSPFLFKLRAPHSAICGFAHFAHYSALPDWLAWECFGEGNGCAALAGLPVRVATIRARIRYDARAGSEDIGCIHLVSPTFFPRGAWVPQPTGWPPRAQTAIRHDLTTGEGRRVWEACLARAETLTPSIRPAGLPPSRQLHRRYGDARLVQPRLGQATFRVAVLGACARACAVTGEHSLPALEAAHIRSYAEKGPHEIRNGILLRADLHRLFDTGYVTVTPDLRLEVGSRLREDYHNGRSHYPLHGASALVPAAASHRPERKFLEWHNEHVFRG